MTCIGEYILGTASDAKRLKFRIGKSLRKYKGILTVLSTLY